MVAADPAAATTSSIDAPTLAWTAASTAPSTSGASLMRTRGSVRVAQVLERQLETQRGASEIKQDDRAIGAVENETDRLADARCART